MQILGASSLASVLKWVLDVAGGLMLFAGAVIVIALAVRVAVPDMKLVPIRLSGELEEPAGVPLIQGPSGATLDRMEARVAFQTPSRGLVLAYGLYCLVTLGLAAALLLHLRRVLASLTAGEVFTRANARRLRIIAVLSLVAVFVQEAWDLCSRYLLETTVQFAWGRLDWPVPDFAELFFALVLFVIAEAARVGAALEEERALTV